MSTTDDNDMVRPLDVLVAYVVMTLSYLCHAASLTVVNLRHVLISQVYGSTSVGDILLGDKLVYQLFWDGSYFYA